MSVNSFNASNPPLTTKGDLYGFSTVPARIPVGTNGQVLKANSATATGLEWAADSTGMTNPMTTTGDTIYSSSGSTPARLAVGTTGQVLTVAGGVPTWAAPAGGSLNWTLLNDGGTALSGSTSTTISGINHDNILILVQSSRCGTAQQPFDIKFNSVEDYRYAGYRQRYNSTYASAFWTAQIGTTATSIPFVETSTDTSSNGSGYCYITGGKGTGRKGFWSNGALQTATNNGEFFQLGGMSATMAAITSVTFLNRGANNFNGGTIYVYGA
jgi:hypothetical protein